MVVVAAFPTFVVKSMRVDHHAGRVPRDGGTDGMKSGIERLVEVAGPALASLTDGQRVPDGGC
jgi:hypothetical protein